MTPISYVWLWLLSIISVAAFAADIFTAVNLLILDKWSSQIQPTIPFKYSKWIFAVCIMISIVLYAYAWQRALRVIKRGGVAESYMDPLAVQIQSMRGKGYKRFLVFAELTKSKKGADYVALFVYFQFKGENYHIDWCWITADSPRRMADHLRRSWSSGRQCLDIGLCHESRSCARRRACCQNRPITSPSVLLQYRRALQRKSLSSSHFAHYAFHPRHLRHLCHFTFGRPDILHHISVALYPTKRRTTEHLLPAEN